jgi:hypothetical protein
MPSTATPTTWRGLMPLLVGFLLPLALADGADAQVFRFDSDPYRNANFKATVVDEITFESTGNGKWKSQLRCIRADDGVEILAAKPFLDYVEESRGGGEVVLRPAKEGGVPAKLNDDGYYFFRNYPKRPLPEGVDPNEKRWWRSDGKVKWLKGRPN